MDISLTTPLSAQTTNVADAMSRRLEQLDEKKLSAGEDPKKLRTACEDFESYFLYMLMKEMRKTVPETAFMHVGRGEEIFRDMMDEETAKNISHSQGSGIGIADMLYRQLSRQVVAKAGVPGVPATEATVEK